MKKYRLIHHNSSIEIPEGRFELGRSIECNLVLDDPSVSRIHATITVENGLIFLEDKRSRNGCLVNNNKINSKIQLYDGDRISIGHQSMRIIALNKIADADRTLGLTTCKSCGAWVASNEDKCSNCGEIKDIPAEAFETFQDMVPIKPKPTHKLTQQPQMMVAALIRKAISMNRLEEAEKMLGNLMESALNKKPTDKEILEIGLATIALAEVSGDPRHISSLFAFHQFHGSLMPRETVEALYGVVGKVGYRVCTEMNRYLTILSKISDNFTPGQKFVHKRINGLIGICS